MKAERAAERAVAGRGKAVTVQRRTGASVETCRPGLPAAAALNDQLMVAAAAAAAAARPPSARRGPAARVDGVGAAAGAVGWGDDVVVDAVRRVEREAVTEPNVKRQLKANGRQ